MVQATETVKLLLGKGEPLIGRLLTYDALGMRFREVRLRQDPKCPLCGERPTIQDLTLHADTSEATCVIEPGPAAAADAAAPPERAGGGAGRSASA